MDSIQPAFYVSDEDVTNDKLPTTGLEYLRRVRKEASTCPDIVVADLDVSPFHCKQTVKVISTNGCQPAPMGYAPSLRWQQVQVAEFSHLRQKLLQFRISKDKGKITKRREELPDAADEFGWYQLCFGHNQLHLAGFKDIDMETSLRQPTNPLLSVMLALDQPTVDELLYNHINWFRESGFSHPQGQWLYALLACLEKPLNPESCHSLRILARLCSSLRATLDTPSHPHLAALNLLLCLVARYFDQGDMLDE
ncbi:PREDICTED: gem-associated protein 2-like isoform X2 [Priapulus caudatus]|nr:PREDICTED: gem-associated protein 2-like isoform X2 [Priapulus caudatus]XP_014677055.1 PREDICTED: gem-associated protein 2-like isoform X2 [Priapulus caudatus]